MGNPNPQRHIENLKPWKPGQSGNPGGVPKGGPGFSEMIRKHTRDGAILMKIALEIAQRGKKDSDRMEAIRFLADRGFGKAVETQIRKDGDKAPEIVFQPVKASG